MITETALDNVLVSQKNKILMLLNQREYERALLRLETLADLWLQCNYGYKLREITDRIGREVRECGENVPKHATKVIGYHNWLSDMASQLYSMAYNHDNS